MDGAGEWDARAALREADWDVLTPRLVASARWRYIVATGRCPHGSAAEELVQEAIVRVLDGRRSWHRDDPPELWRFLSGVMRSIVDEIFKKRRRETQRRDDQDIDGIEVPSVASVLFDPRLDLEPRLDLIEEAIGDDEELQTLYLAILECPGKREDIAAYLEMPVSNVSVLTKKMQRRVIQLAKTKTPTASESAAP
ncbi:MAG: ECF-type sigma factor [Kofleriaceae bacterium]|nr:ECF-type sigma factor [Kofleriaceae bacterium]